MAGAGRQAWWKAANSVNQAGISVSRGPYFALFFQGQTLDLRISALELPQQTYKLDGLLQQKFILSQFWRPKFQDPGFRKVPSEEEPVPRLSANF